MANGSHAIEGLVRLAPGGGSNRPSDTEVNRLPLCPFSGGAYAFLCDLADRLRLSQWLPPLRAWTSLRILSGFEKRWSDLRDAIVDQVLTVVSTGIPPPRTSGDDRTA
jgi:hypothetical protein